MSSPRARQFFGSGMGEGGGLSLPYTYTPGADGALPGSVWVGATFAVSGGVIINTPGVGDNLLTDPGLEATYTDGLCETLTKTGSPTVTESADVHGGSKAQAFTATAGANRLNYPVVAGVAGAWYRHSIWGKRTAGTGIGTRLYFEQSAALPAAAASFPITAAAYAKIQVGIISTSTANLTPYAVRELDSSNWDSVIVDDGLLERLTYSTLFAMVKTQVSRAATVKIQPETAADGTLTFVVAWADAIASPTTYLIGYLFKTGGSTVAVNVGLLKCVNGTYSPVIASAVVTEVADAWLEIRPVDDDTVALYYNNTQVGSNTDVTNVPGAYCGLGITGGNAVQSFFVG